MAFGFCHLLMLKIHYILLLLRLSSSLSVCMHLILLGLGLPPELLNGNGPLGAAGQAQMESMNMELAATVTSGGPGPFAFGLNGFAPPHGPGLMDQCVDRGGQGGSSSATKELEVITVASMQTPCRCTNSYAYL